jgi:hypothetical protein
MVKIQSINKYQGLMLLKQCRLPTISWNVFTYDTTLCDSYRWTLRAVRDSGNDFGLPIFLDISSKEAIDIGRRLLDQYSSNKYILLVYPYFTSEKSGTVKVEIGSIVVEAVKGNCSDLTRYSKLDISLIYKDTRDVVYGDITFFTDEELVTIERYASRLRRQFFRMVLDGFIVVLEWSFATYKNTDKEKFLFQELRVITCPGCHLENGKYTTRYVRGHFDVF